jgi:hypothetical protein
LNLKTVETSAITSSQLSPVIGFEVVSSPLIPFSSLGAALAGSAARCSSSCCALSFFLLEAVEAEVGVFFSLISLAGSAAFVGVSSAEVRCFFLAGGDELFCDFSYSSISAPQKQWLAFSLLSLMSLLLLLSLLLP